MLRFRLFSSHCTVSRSSDREEIHLFPAARNLLAYLLVYRHRSHTRDMLAETFWGHDEERARQCLRTTLWRLRKELEGDDDAACYLQVSAEGNLSFRLESEHWLDIEVFEEGVEQGLTAFSRGMTPAEAAALEEACAYYTCDLLESVYDDWAIRERERLRLLYLQALTGLLRYYRQEGAYERGLYCGKRILEMDPLRENVHREMMRLHAGLGQRTLAARQYEECRSLLAQELGIEPMPETDATYRQIVAGADNVPVGEQELDVSHSLQEIVQEIGLALHHIEQTQIELKQKLRQLVQMMERGAEEGEPTRRKQ